MNLEQRNHVLRILQKDARLSNAQIAERMMISEKDVAEIIKHCEAESIIRGYHTLINEEKLPRHPVRAMIEISVEPERDVGFDRIARNLAKFPEVSDVILFSGNYDLQLIVIGDSLDEIANFVSRKLAPLEGVRSTRTHFMLKKYKEAGFRLEDDEEYERLKISL